MSDQYLPLDHRDAAGAVEPQQHPAVRAWHSLGHSGAVPAKVHTLKGKRTNAVFCLDGITASGSDVIAKRAVRSKVRVERTIYESLLPALDIRTVGYLGYAEDADGVTAWIFLDRAEGEKYDPRKSEHRWLAGRWLAVLHSQAAALPALCELPDRSTKHYLSVVQSSRARIRENIGNVALDNGHRQLLGEVVLHLDALELRWSWVEELCDAMPRTLIHGDFASKNMCVDVCPKGLELEVFDWGTAGWGSPAADLVQASGRSDSYWASPDLEIYREIAGSASLPLPQKDVLGVAHLGKIFRSLSALNGDANALRTPWIVGTMQKFPVYLTHLTDGMRAVGIESSGLPPRARTRRTAEARLPEPQAPADSMESVRKAWRSLSPTTEAVSRLVALQQKPLASVYCLFRAGRGGADVIAKQCRRDRMSTERAMYEQWLPQLPLVSLHYYGCVESADQLTSWLFLECAPDHSYSPADPHHRILAARWLATLHTSSSFLPGGDRLPARGSQNFRQHLRSLHERIQLGIVNPALQDEGRAILRDLRDGCDEIGESWERITEPWSRMPECLVHGDLLPKNLRVSARTAAADLLVFDWEHAGWGAPLLDLAGSPDGHGYWVSPELQTYHEAVRSIWTDLSLVDLRRGASAARLFHLLVWADGDAKNLDSPWLERSLAKLEVYRQEIQSILRQLGSKGRPS